MSVDCLQPVPFGLDAFGDLHKLHTTSTHTAFYGITRRAGKTSAAMAFVLYVLLDPKARLVLVDGKNDDSDWQILVDVAESYVGGCTTTSLDAFERLLLRLTAINEERATGDHGVTEPIFIVIDELKMIRGAAKTLAPKQLERIDQLLISLATSCAGRYMHLIFTPQRGTVEFLPGDLSGNIGQRVQGCAAHAGEIGYSIHCRPEILPAPWAGEYLVSSDDGGSAVLVSVPFITPQQRLELVDAIQRIRAAAAAPEPSAALSMVKHVPEPEDPERPATWQELVAVILEEADEPMTTREIHAALVRHDPDVAPTSFPDRFGRDLTADAESGSPTVTRALTRARTRAWALAEGRLPANREYQDPSARSQAPSPLLLTAAP